MPLWLIIAGVFAGWVLWSGKRAQPSQDADSTISHATKKSATIGALTFGFMLLMRVGPWRSWALLSSAISALPLVARLLQSQNPDASRPAAHRAPQLTRQEAAQLLDIPADAPRDAIEAAYRRLMTRVHPDAGGNAYLAQLVNEARDRLLG